jgi:hypothetical protein
VLLGDDARLDAMTTPPAGGTIDGTEKQLSPIVHQTK